MRYFHAWICHESHTSTSGGTIFIKVWVNFFLAESCWIYKYVPIKNDSCRSQNDSPDFMRLSHFFSVWVIFFLGGVIYFLVWVNLILAESFWKCIETHIKKWLPPRYKWLGRNLKRLRRKKMSESFIIWQSHFFWWQSHFCFDGVK